MSQINVDPEKLRNFANELKKFTEVINNYFEVIPNEMNRLGSTWQDQEFEKFKRDFIPLVQKLKKFTQESKKIIPSLERDATTIEEYHKRLK